MEKTWFIYQKEWSRPWNKKFRKENWKSKIIQKETRTKITKTKKKGDFLKKIPTIFKLRAYTSYSDMHKRWNFFFFWRVLDFGNTKNYETHKLY